VRLRLSALRELETPVVMETHGGAGKIYARCYGSIPEGVVFETSPMKTAILGKQRPHWAVYEADCVAALAASVGSHIPINFVDIDPYGGPWCAIDAFFSGIKPKVPRLVFAVNDGLRNRLKLHVAWNTEGLQDAVDQFGNAAIYEQYLDVCKWMMQRKAAKAGYILRRWTAYFCRPVHRPKGQIGDVAGDNITHYAAVLERSA